MASNPSSAARTDGKRVLEPSPVQSKVMAYVLRRMDECKSKIQKMRRRPRSKKRPNKRQNDETTITHNDKMFCLPARMMRDRQKGGRHVEWLLMSALHISPEFRDY